MTPAPRVLLVEDEAFLRELVAEGLTDAGYRVFEASDGSSGLQALESDLEIDLLLSDIKLPDIDGYRVAEAGTALRPGLKVILMTGYAPSPLPPALEPVVYRVLQKPFSLEALPGTIAAALGS
ncbi:MAG TPA: response regulator [Frateuria sp.]|uniref:response regulator n=1 Tax=Frateuria sp. TaxID=2211372 RepID=UPI002DF4C658|nr:response regulator [Frateuria sp.]